MSETSPLVLAAELSLIVDDIAGKLSAAFVPIEPIRIEERPNGETLRFWMDGPRVKVFTCENHVFWSQAADSYPASLEVWPDWTPMSVNEARSVANALLAAAQDVNGRFSIVGCPNPEPTDEGIA